MGRHHESLRFQRIKALLEQWAEYMDEKAQGGYPTQAPFATERVQSSNRSTETYIAVMPEDVKKLNNAIESLAPIYKRVIGLEYCKRGPQKAKAAEMEIGRTQFAYHLIACHEQLEFAVYGESVQQMTNRKFVQQQVI